MKKGFYLETEDDSKLNIDGEVRCLAGDPLLRLNDIYFDFGTFGRMKELGEKISELAGEMEEEGNGDCT